MTGSRSPISRLRRAWRAASMIKCLSGNRAGVAGRAVDDEGGSELEEGEVVVGLLLPADEHAARHAPPVG